MANEDKSGLRKDDSEADLQKTIDGDTGGDGNTHQSLPELAHRWREDTRKIFEDRRVRKLLGETEGDYSPEEQMDDDEEPGAVERAQEVFGGKMSARFAGALEDAEGLERPEGAPGLEEHYEYVDPDIITYGNF